MDRDCVFHISGLSVTAAGRLFNKHVQWWINLYTMHACYSNHAQFIIRYVLTNDVCTEYTGFSNKACKLVYPYNNKLLMIVISLHRYILYNEVCSDQTRSNSRSTIYN